jgi:hypothetical protein
MRIAELNQRDLLRSPPALELLFAVDRSMDVVEPFAVEQALNSVLVCETLDPVEFVFEYPGIEFAGHPDVERS